MLRANLTSAGDTFLVFDLEFSFDREAHSRYLERERDDANPRIRWPFHHVAAASAMMLTTSGAAGARQIEVVSFRTFARDEMTEREIVAKLFEVIAELPENTTVVTYGGQSKDCAVLRAAAITHGLQLPLQLHARAIHYNQPLRRHLDLAIAVKGDAPFVHMTEIAARAGIPCKLGLKAHEVGQAAERGRWSEVKAHVEMDVITCALLLGRHLYSTSVIDASAWAADSAIGYAVLRSHAHRDYASSIEAWLAGRGAATMNERLKVELAIAA